MAPRGALSRLVTPGLDPKALITGLLFSFLMMLPYSSGLPVRTERLISENDVYYWVELDNDRIQCKLCPAGTYVKEPCTTQFSSGTCEVCPEGTFIAFSSGLSECLPCSRCRNDQEELASCSIVKNTVCHCKKGTFCPPNQVCEICMPCTTSCPDDQVVKAPCNSTSDIRCTTPGSPTDSNENIAMKVTIPLVIFFVVLFSIIAIYACWKKKAGSKIIGKLNFRLCKENEDLDETRNGLLNTYIPLQFKEGIDPDTKYEIIAKSCAIIVDVVPVKKFESLMQHLGVSHNEIDVAKADNIGTVKNQNSAMLQAWYQKKDFDINGLLKALRTLRMKKAAIDIQTQLTSNGLFVKQTQDSS